MASRTTCRARTGAPLLLGVVILSAACAPDAAERRALIARDPCTRAQAAVDVSRSRDRAYTESLINLLCDRDAGVRMYAILSLRHLYGEDFGYRYFDPEGVRQAAFERWQAAFRSGELTPAPESFDDDAAPATGDSPPAGEPVSRGTE